MRPGRVARRDCEYERRGTANVFCGVEPKAGRHFPKPLRPFRRSSSPTIWWRLALHYPAANTIHLVMDNLNSTSPQGRWGPLRREGGRLAVGPVHRPLHAQARQLAQSGGDRNQPLLPAVFGTAKNPIAGRSAARNQGLGAENEP